MCLFIFPKGKLEFLFSWLFIFLLNNQVHLRNETFKVWDSNF